MVLILLRSEMLRCQAGHMFQPLDLKDLISKNQQEFYQAIKRSRDPPALEVWAKTLPLSDLLAFCLQAEAVSDPSSDPIRQLTCISRSRIEVAVEEFTGCLLQKLLPERIKYLKERIDLQDAKAEKAATGAANKFTVYQMNAGKISATQESLAERIGEWQGASDEPESEEYEEYEENALDVEPAAT